MVDMNCACGRGEIIAQGVCFNCRTEDEAKFRAAEGLAPRARAVGTLIGGKTHTLCAVEVRWGGVRTMRWAPRCSTRAGLYGSKIEGAEVTCLRCAAKS